jgi:hypothetical protein
MPGSSEHEQWLAHGVDDIEQEALGGGDTVARRTCARL